MNEQKPASKDAISILIADRQRIRDLFEEVSNTDVYRHGQLSTQRLMDAACTELKVQTLVAEELFFPAARRALPGCGNLLGVGQHAYARKLIAQIESSDATDAMTWAKFRQLGNFVDRHARQLAELFPMIRNSGINLQALGAEMAKRKADLVFALLERPSAAIVSTAPPPTLWNRFLTMASMAEATRP